MKKTIGIKLSVFFLASILLVANANALGLGVSFPSYMVGSSDVEYDWDDRSDQDVDADISSLGGGFVMDTAVANDRVFNYRFNFEHEKLEYEYDEISMTHDFARTSLNQTFGFGIVRNEDVRIWFGPHISLSYISAKDSHTVGNLRETIEVDAVGFGIGPVIGTNIHIGHEVSLGLEAGYRKTFYFGTADIDHSMNHYDSDSGYFDSSESAFFIKCSILFRIKDIY